MLAIFLILEYNKIYKEYENITEVNKSMKLSWNIGDTVEVVEGAMPYVKVGTRGRIDELCENNTGFAHCGVDFGASNGDIWYYLESELKLISKAEGGNR